MNLTHDQIQERIDRTINNHQFTCQTLGYNIYVLDKPIDPFTLPVEPWHPDASAYNKSYLVLKESELETPALKSFIEKHRYRIHDLSFVDDVLVIADQR